jgi:hypothetical protein
MAGRLDLRHPLAQAVLLVHGLYKETPLSEPLLAWSRQDKKAISLAHHSLKAMLMDEAEYFAPSFCDKWRRESYYLDSRTMLPLRDYLQRQPVRMEVWKLLPLPDRLFWLYYPLRLLVWFKRQYM